MNMTGTHRINKNKAIELIMQELEKGTTYKECFSVNFRNLPLTERTFTNYWKEANEAYSQRQKSIQSELMSVHIEHEKERLKKSLLKFDEKREICAKIARGEAYESGGEIVIPSPSDRIRAMEYDSKLMGDIASMKINTEVNMYNIPKLPDILDRTR